MWGNKYQHGCTLLHIFMILNKQQAYWVVILHGIISYLEMFMLITVTLVSELSEICCCCCWKWKICSHYRQVSHVIYCMFLLEIRSMPVCDSKIKLAEDNDGHCEHAMCLWCTSVITHRTHNFRHLSDRKCDCQGEKTIGKRKGKQKLVYMGNKNSCKITMSQHELWTMIIHYIISTVCAVNIRPGVMQS